MPAKLGPISSELADHRRYSLFPTRANRQLYLFVVRVSIALSLRFFWLAVKQLFLLLSCVPYFFVFSGSGLVRRPGLRKNFFAFHHRVSTSASPHVSDVDRRNFSVRRNYRARSIVHKGPVEKGVKKISEASMVACTSDAD